MSKTLENLMNAFAGESQANRKYTAFAKKAEAEGYPQIAKLFRAAAEAETIHALEEFRVAGKIGSTKENLQSAVSGETYEYTDMYPEFTKQAQEEANKPAERILKHAMAAEKVHAELYQQALDTIDQPAEAFDYYLCPICGYIHARSAPDSCPICGNPGKRFVVVK